MDQHEHSAERDACMPAKAGVLTLKVKSVNQNSAVAEGRLEDHWEWMLGKSFKTSDSEMSFTD